MEVEDLLKLLNLIQSSGLNLALGQAGLNCAVYEPLTAFTDAILTAWIAFWAAFLFARANGSKPVVLWGWAFLASAFTSLSGVAFHGSRMVLTSIKPDGTVDVDKSVKSIGLVWKLVPITSGLMILFLGCAASLVWLRPKWGRVARVLLFVEFAGCLWATFCLPPEIANSFKVTLFDAAPVLVALLIGAFFHRHDGAAAAWIGAGVVTTIIAVLIQSSEWHKGHPPDSNDIFHVVQMAAMYLLYRGGAVLGHVPAPGTQRVGLPTT